MIAVYSWMLIEGIHLMNILFLTFIVRRFRFTCYSIIGWGIPAVLTSSWAIAKSVKLGYAHLWTEPTISDPEGILVVTSILITLAVNFLIMFITLFMLLTKLHGQPTGIAGGRKSRGCRTNLLKDQRSHGTCPLGIMSNNPMTLSKTITTLTMTPLQQGLNKSDMELQVNKQITIKQQGIETINCYNNNNSPVITTNTTTTTMTTTTTTTTINDNNQFDSNAEIMNTDNQTSNVLPKTITMPTKTIRIAEDNVTGKTDKKVTKTKILKSSLKNSSDAFCPVATSITASVNSTISQSQPVKYDAKNTMANEVDANNNNSNNYNRKVSKMPSMNRRKVSKLFQRKSIDSNFLSSTISIKEIRKAIKAIIFLMPLLGFSQLIFLIPYSKEFGRVFDYINAIMLSTQGFWVTLIYCFLNSEVQRVLRTRWSVLCSTFRMQSTERIRHNQSLITNPILLSNNNHDTERQSQS
ncbi:unnamed protein product [Schistosoma turkestanicum]|nr:unnamed protein product [Schistosoma turkestanicum]